MISIIIVNYNVKSYLKKCIDSIFNSIANLDFEIVIVDNNSNEPIIDLKSEKISVYQMDKNSGFSSAVNFGISKAKKEVLLLLNPDTIIIGEAIEVLYDYVLSDQRIGVVGCKVLNSDGTYQLSSKRSFPYFFHSLFYVLDFHKLFPRLNKYNYLHEDEDVTLDVDAVSGSCMIFRKKILDSVGNFDENFFLYFEDTDFCLRVAENGYRVVYYPKASILHYKGKSLQLSNRRIKNEFYSSLKYFFYKYKSKFSCWFLIQFFLPIGILIRKIVVCVKRY
ncbi:MAG: hypothetical protein CMG64_00640 [Candidatus Marinimicrobia bacterium]|nr:hypothetical protein [Candidatus Neomarinimicrobiota bacterium]|tara:strand:+ start:18018 stop:18851 length:834 start_codon:yes stop_codon:yes gene_type:complete